MSRTEKVTKRRRFVRFVIVIDQCLDVQCTSMQSNVIFKCITFYNDFFATLNINGTLSFKLLLNCISLNIWIEIIEEINISWIKISVNLFPNCEEKSFTKCILPIFFMSISLVLAIYFRLINEIWQLRSITIFFRKWEIGENGRRNEYHIVINLIP